MKIIIQKLRADIEIPKGAKAEIHNAYPPAFHRISQQSKGFNEDPIPDEEAQKYP